MEQRRYGRFTPSDYWASWVGIVILLAFVIISIILYLPIWFVVFPTVYAVIWLRSIFLPHCERFSICDTMITIKRGKRKREIVIPQERVLIISYVDNCPPLAIRTAAGNQTHILKDKYAVSILRKVSLNFVLEHLHRNYIRKYTTSIIQTVFDDYYFIYSFVCNDEVFSEVPLNPDDLLIVPESLADKLPVNLKTSNVHIDTGY